MPDPLMVFCLVASGLLLVAGAWFGAGSPAALVGLFGAHGVRDWPTGVQEADAPRFAVAHLDSLRPDAAGPAETIIDGHLDAHLDGCGDLRPELIDLGSRHFDARSR
jgi:hypothetical protein